MANVAILVICSDIYDFGHYQQWNKLASAFIVPTQEHKVLLGAITECQIFIIEEPLDTISRINSHSISNEFDGWLAWFGYPESFSKGMRSLLPTIGYAVKHDWLKGIKIITTGKLYDGAPNWMRLIPFSEQGLAVELGRSKYAILSHFPYDLHCNSYIKTDNKALLSLSLGAIPICSDTPSYGRLLRKTGLQDYLFRNSNELKFILENLDKFNYGNLDMDKHFLISNAIAERSPNNVAERIANAVRAIQNLRYCE